MSLSDRIRIAVYELNLLLRGAAMGGDAAKVDTVDRTDSDTGATYTEVVAYEGQGDAPREGATD